MRQERSVLQQVAATASDKVSVRAIRKYPTSGPGRNEERVKKDPTNSPLGTPMRDHRTSKRRMIAGPTTTIISTGRMQKIVGKIIFIDSLAALASAA